MEQLKPQANFLEVIPPAEVSGDKLELSPMTILEWGSKSTDKLTEMANQTIEILNKTTPNQAIQTMSTVASIMNRLDLQEIKALDPTEKPNFWKRIFNRGKNGIEELIKKYDNVERDLVSLTKTLNDMEAETKVNAHAAKNMHQATLSHIIELDEYVNGAESSLVSMEEYLKNTEMTEYEQNQATMITEMLKQRIHDLKMSRENAVISLKELDMAQAQNFNLARTINSTFTITLPILKSSIANGLLMKKQADQAQTLNHIQNATNKLIVDNAKRTVEQGKAIAELSYKSTIDVNNIITAQQTIIKGIEEINTLALEMETKRAQALNTLEKSKLALPELNEREALSYNSL